MYRVEASFFGLGKSPPAWNWTHVSGLCLCPLWNSSLEQDPEPSPLSLIKGSLPRGHTWNRCTCCFSGYLLSPHPIPTHLYSYSLPSAHQLFSEGPLPEQGKQTHSSGKHCPVHKDERDCVLTPLWGEGIAYYLGAAHGVESDLLLPVLFPSKTMFFHLPGDSLHVLIGQLLLVSACGHWHPFAFMQSCSFSCEQSI